MRRISRAYETLGAPSQHSEAATLDGLARRVDAHKIFQELEQALGLQMFRFVRP